VSRGMLGKVILPLLTSGEGDSTCRIIVSNDRAGIACSSGTGGPDVALLEDAIACSVAVAVVKVRR
jgi:hypothetical protein